MGASIYAVGSSVNAKNLGCGASVYGKKLWGGASVYGVGASVYGVGASVYGVGASVYGNHVIMVSPQSQLDFDLDLGLLRIQVWV